MHNFNGYFSKDNPKELGSKFSKESRFHRQKMRFKVGLQDPLIIEESEEDSLIDPNALQVWVDSFKDENLSSNPPEESL